MSLYIELDGIDCMRSIEENKKNLGMHSINLSSEKTIFFNEGIGEYTSWFMDGNFVSQYGVETASIRPQGKIPSDDLYSIAKGTATALSSLSINPIGATARIKLGVLGAKRLWSIELKTRDGISPKVQLIDDGGLNTWECMNCPLVEIPLKETFIRNQQEKKKKSTYYG